MTTKEMAEKQTTDNDNVVKFFDNIALGFSETLRNKRINFFKQQEEARIKAEITEK